MKKLRKVLPWLPILAAITPLIAAAQVSPITTLLSNIRQWVNTLIPILMAIAVVVFLWGIVKYITAGGDAEKEKAARGYIIYGLIGITVMVAIWGFVAFILSTLGINPNASINAPAMPF